MDVQIKKHPFFKTINWVKLGNREIPSKFKPEVRHVIMSSNRARRECFHLHQVHGGHQWISEWRMGCQLAPSVGLCDLPSRAGCDFMCGHVIWLQPRFHPEPHSAVMQPCVGSLIGCTEILVGG